MVLTMFSSTITNLSQNLKIVNNNISILNKQLSGVDKVIYLNGKRLVITGVNRHEWNARTGRCIGIDIKL